MMISVLTCGKRSQGMENAMGPVFLEHQCTRLCTTLLLLYLCRYSWTGTGCTVRFPWPRLGWRWSPGMRLRIPVVEPVTTGTSTVRPVPSNRNSIETAWWPHMVSRCFCPLMAFRTNILRRWRCVPLVRSSDCARLYRGHTGKEMFSFLQLSYSD